VPCIAPKPTLRASLLPGVEARSLRDSTLFWGHATRSIGQFKIFRYQSFAKVPAILFDRVRGRVLPSEERDDALPAHFQLLIFRRGSFRSPARPCRN